VMFRLREADLEAASAAAALDALSFGVVQLDGVGRIVQCNREAARILESGEGLGARHSFLHAAESAAHELLRQALDATAATIGDGAAQLAQVAHFSEVVRIPKSASGEAYVLQMSRLPAASSFGPLNIASRMVVFITDERRPATADLDVLRRIYGLSPAEARCALALGEGKLSQAADRLQVSVDTVKTQLKQIYAKTGCHSRADLTRLLLSLAHV
jgi:DNA-binding CsgD family transcriptional regulator